MYLSTGLKTENYIYLIEAFSMCLISIHIPSKETRIEACLPWKFTEKKIGMLSLNCGLLIYSPAINHFLVYDRLKRQISIMELQGMEVDEAGFYYSNVLVDQDDLIILPFKGKEIKRYGMDGKLKQRDSQWRFAISKEYGCDEKVSGNIRIDSACIVGKQLYFSLLYGSQNYLCKYGLNQDENLCSIVYNSEDIAIKGVYVYPDLILFRRIFLDRTEIILITPNSRKEKKIIIDHLSAFDGDIYGNIHHLRVALKNKIMEIDTNELKIYRTIYNLKKQDIYIAKGIIFDVVKNEILVFDTDYISKYSIEKTVEEIENSSLYQKEYKEMFDGRCVYEEKYKVYSLIKYLIELSSVMIEKGNYRKNMGVGELLWNAIR